MVTPLLVLAYLTVGLFLIAIIEATASDENPPVGTGIRVVFVFLWPLFSGIILLVLATERLGRVVDFIVSGLANLIRRVFIKCKGE